MNLIKKYHRLLSELHNIQDKIYYSIRDNIEFVLKKDDFQLNLTLMDECIEFTLDVDLTDDEISEIERRTESHRNLNGVFELL